MFGVGPGELLFTIPLMMLSVAVPVVVIVLLLLIYQRVARIEEQLARRG